MTSRHLIATAALAVLGLAASQVALACQDGKLSALGGTARAEVSDDSATLDNVAELKLSDARSKAYGVGYGLVAQGSAELDYSHISEETLEGLETNDSADIAGLDPISLANDTIFHF